MRRFVIWPAFFTLFFMFVTTSLPAQTHPAKKSSNPEEAIPLSLPREIRHQILMLPFYSVFDSIDFTLKGNIVTLTGQVLRPTLKEDAEAIIKSIEGVDTVINQIEVLPVSSADNDLRRAV